MGKSKYEDEGNQLSCIKIKEWKRKISRSGILEGQLILYKIKVSDEKGRVEVFMKRTI